MAIRLVDRALPQFQVELALRPSELASEGLPSACLQIHHTMQAGHASSPQFGTNSLHISPPS